MTVASKPKGPVKAEVVKEPQTTETEDATEASPIDTIRNQPTDSELIAKRTARKAEKEVHVKVRTASGGSMWDPDAALWIEGRATLAVKTAWLDRQVAAKKILVVED